MTSFRLKQLRIENYRCFAALTLPLEEDTTVLFAGNGGWKTAYALPGDARTVLGLDRPLALLRRAHERYLRWHRAQVFRTDLIPWSNCMFLHVVEARYVRDYVVWLRFNDGTAGEVDLASELEGPVFGPLPDIDLFRSFTVAYHTLTWPNGADFAPEFLREHVSITA